MVSSKKTVFLWIFYATWSNCLLALMWEMEKQEGGPLLFSYMTMLHKCRLYLHIDSISQMDNLCCLWFVLEEEWGMKAALNARPPLVNTVCRPWGVTSHPVSLSPLTDRPHCLLNASLLSISCHMHGYHSTIHPKQQLLNSSIAERNLKLSPHQEWKSAFTHVQYLFRILMILFI